MRRLALACIALVAFAAACGSAQTGSPRVLVITAAPEIMFVTATLAPTGTPTRTPSPTPIPTATRTPTPAPAAVMLKPMSHEAQTWNNCGPDSVAMILSYYGHQVGQQTINDEGLSIFTPPPELAEWISASRYGLLAQAYGFPTVVDHNLALMRYLLANQIPVIVLQRLGDGETMSHYRVIQGYDDKAGEFIANDPLLGANYHIRYDRFIALMGRSYPGPALIPVYPPKLQSFVQSLAREWGAYPK